MERTDLMDTKPWAHAVIVQRLRQMTPEERVRLVFEISELSRQMHLLAMKRLEAEKVA